jgi:ATP-dependent DNA helicase RecG
VQAEPATPVPYRQEVIEAFKGGLGFELTRAQKRAIWDVYRDIQRPVPMNRLLNGDVGSGKTAVAAAGVAMTHAAGQQSVVMAPTEILARQHLARFRSYLEESFASLRVELLVSGQPAPERRRVLMAAASGHCALLVGTHALIEEAVELPNLGLAVVDEQHRFGTGQREQLRAKGTGKPHFLAMTATPIPRTLALALYGDMAVSIIDDWVCPLVEESEKSEARSATAEFDRLRREVFPDLRLSLVHGRMKDKDAVMRDFASGESDVLVATAVVEVGVDVPNASVMLIEGAERFGLAQLHQFRGRVGRGAAQSHCLLFADDPGEKTLARLRLMTQTHDGFQLAMEDMRLRGAGELIGLRQHGMSDLAMQALLQPNLVSEARDEAERVLAKDPTLQAEPALRQRLEVIRERMKTG